MTYPITVTVTFDTSTGAQFGYPFILDTVNGKLNKGVLGTAIPKIYDLSDQTTHIQIRGGYNLLRDQFEAGIAYIRILDPNGDFNPQNTSSPYYPLNPLYKIRVSGTYEGTSYDQFSGYITNYDYSYPTKEQTIGYVDITAVDGFRLFQLANISTVTGAVAGQLAGERINTLLDQVGFPNSMREIQIDPTDSTMMADPATYRSLLAAIKNVEMSTLGAFYMDGSGDAVYKSRHWVMQSAYGTPIYFSNAGDGIPYWNIKFALDDKLIINQASFTQYGSTNTQTSINATSAVQYFQHSINIPDMVAQTAQQLADAAGNYVATRAFTTLRVDEMTLDLSTPNYHDGIVAALNGDYFQNFSIKNVGQDGTTITKVLQVVGIAHDIDPKNWRTTFTTSEPITGSFLLNSSLYGRLDDTNSILAY